MDEQKLRALGESQRAYFQCGKTRSYESRKRNLKKLADAIALAEQPLLEALERDFRKPRFESWASEIGLVLAEIEHALSHLKSWMSANKVNTPLLLFPSRSRIVRAPLGRCFIIGPWNYPFNLVMAPLVGAIAGGNTALVKPSELTPATSEVIADMLSSTFREEFVGVLQGNGAEVVPRAIDSFRPDHIFFTGSVAVGKAIARQAVETLTPVVLELGGKSPAIVDGTTEVHKTARRLVLGKFLNAGQTCVAPDYLLVRRGHEQRLTAALVEEIERAYGPDPLTSPHLASIIHKRSFERLKTLMDGVTVAFGGQVDESSYRIAPTLLTDVSFEKPVMQQEIFGPLLPILTYDTDSELFEAVRKNPDPLALYVFSQDHGFVDRILGELSFGGAAVNNAALHLANPNLPFGGIRTSGHGSYHGRFGFETFTHAKGILDSGLWFDPSFKYAPYTERALRLVKKLMT